MSDRAKSFVSLTTLKHGPPDPARARAEIRKIYFSTSKNTIEADFAHAIELLKSLSEEDRDRVAVYMEGLAEMRKDFRGQVESGKSRKSKRHKARGAAGKVGGGRRR